MAVTLEHPVALSRESASTCFVCGPNHPTGLHLQFAIVGDEMVEARWLPNRSWEGYEKIIHGGMLSTLLDEAMAKAIAAIGIQALTAELRVRFRRPLPPGEEIVIRGWVLDRAKRRLKTEAVIVSGVDGREFAHGWATFLTA